MKLVLQISLGVFLGGLASQLTVDAWRSYQENMVKQAGEKLRAEREKVRIEQGERIRALLMQGHRNNAGAMKPPKDFVPDDGG